MSRFTNCGVYDCGMGLCPIYADCVTGEVILASDLQGNCYMSELTVLDALPVSDDDSMQKVMKHFDADGIILSSRNLITLKGSTAEYRNYVDTSVVEHTVEFDTDIQCEITVFDDDSEI